jgi:hypothetical protein
MSLHNPLMRQVLAQSQEPRRRQLDWLTALEERAHDVRSQMGQSNYSEAFGHCLDAVVRPRQKLAPNRKSFADQGGEACADFGSDAILDGRRFPLPERCNFASIDMTTGSRSGRWFCPPASSAAATFVRHKRISIRSAATFPRSTTLRTRLVRSMRGMASQRSEMY